MIDFGYTILQIVPRLDRGGAERTAVEIAGAIVQAGGRALVATSGGAFVPDVEKAGGEVVELPVHSKNPAIMWLNARQLIRLIKEEGVDLVHARSRAPAWSALAACRKTGKPFITTYHGAYRSAGPIKRYYNSSMVRSDCVIANSRFTAEAIQKTYGLPPEKLRVICPGADLKLFDPLKVSPRRVNQVSQSWEEIGENTGFRVLMPARLTAWKGHEVAIDAAAFIKERAALHGASGNERALTLVFCGGAQGRREYERALRARIEERGVREMVHLVGDCTDMPAAYGWADAVISPSTLPEAFGRVAVEAGAMAKPVVASDHGGARETVIDRETGYLVEPGDPEALADAIERLRRMPAHELRAMGENGRARAASIYSAAAMCEATLRVYRDQLA